MCVNIYESGFDIIALSECKVDHIPTNDALISSNYKTYDADGRKFVNKWSGIIK